MSKEEFKQFVRNHPKLTKFIKNKEMTWQSFYEIYDMYGDSNEAWKPYLEEKTKVSSIPNIDIMKYIKNIDLDAVQESINSIQRVLGVVGDLTNKSSNTPTSDIKPLYKHLDD